MKRRVTVGRGKVARSLRISNWRINFLIIIGLPTPLDPSKLVRQRGSAALGKLMSLNARVDPLLVELATCTQQAEGPAIKASTLEVSVNGIRL